MSLTLGCTNKKFKMVNYIKYFSAVSISLINATFISFYCYIKANNLHYEGNSLPYFTQILFKLNSFIYLIPLVVAIIGFSLLKKDSKWLELYWHLSLILSLLFLLLCIISCEIPTMLVYEKPIQ